MTHIRHKSHKGDIAIKKRNFDICIQRMKAHMAADELIRGIGYDGKKGGAVGCTFGKQAYALFPKYLDIPEWLARVKEELFEGMSFEKSKTFPLLFLEETRKAILERSADLNKIKAPFMIYTLEIALDTFDHTEYSYVFNTVNSVIELYKNAENDLSKFKDAIDAADAASENAMDRAAGFIDFINVESDAENEDEAGAIRAAQAAEKTAWIAARTTWRRNKFTVTCGDRDDYDDEADYLLKLIMECK